MEEKKLIRLTPYYIAEHDNSFSFKMYYRNHIDRFFLKIQTKYADTNHINFKIEHALFCQINIWDDIKKEWSIIVNFNIKDIDLEIFNKYKNKQNQLTLEESQSLTDKAIESSEFFINNWS